MVEPLKKEEKRELPPLIEKTNPKTSFSKRIRINYLLNHEEEFIKQSVYVCGWAKNIRSGAKGKILFVHLSDGSTPQTIQVVVDSEVPGFEELSKEDAGCCCGFSGEFIKSVGKKQSIEVQVRKTEGHFLKIFGKCNPSEYPLAKIEKSYEFLRDIAHLRSRTQYIGAIARVRNSLIFATHSFFQGKGFVNIHTPIISTSDCEGAGEMFQVTTLFSNAKDKLAGIKENEQHLVDFKEDFFKRPAYLTVSGQLNVETYCHGLCDVYTFGPTFRSEKSKTTRHLAEFWMIEPEIAFGDVNDLMDLAEDYLKYCILYVFKNNMDDLNFFQESKVDETLITRLKNVLENTFERITYTQGIEILQNAIKEKKIEFGSKKEIVWGVDLDAEHEQYLAGKHFGKPIMVRNYPKEIKAFYMKLNEDNKTVCGMDVLLPKIGEIIGGSVREERLELLDKRIEDMKLDKSSYTWYRDLRKFGTCPHAGFGLGFERMIMMMTGVENIQDVIPFPRRFEHANY